MIYQLSTLLHENSCINNKSNDNCSTAYSYQRFVPMPDLATNQGVRKEHYNVLDEISEKIFTECNQDYTIMTSVKW